MQCHSQFGTYFVLQQSLNESAVAFTRFLYSVPARDGSVTSQFPLGLAVEERVVVDSVHCGRRKSLIQQKSKHGVVAKTDSFYEGKRYSLRQRRLVRHFHLPD